MSVIGIGESHRSELVWALKIYILLQNFPLSKPRSLTSPPFLRRLRSDQSICRLLLYLLTLTGRVTGFDCFQSHDSQALHFVAAATQ